MVVPTVLAGLGLTCRLGRGQQVSSGRTGRRRGGRALAAAASLPLGRLSGLARLARLQVIGSRARPRRALRKVVAVTGGDGLGRRCLGGVPVAAAALAPAAAVLSPGLGAGVREAVWFCVPAYIAGAGLLGSGTGPGLAGTSGPTVAAALRPAGPPIRTIVSEGRGTRRVPPAFAAPAVAGFVLAGTGGVAALGRPLESAVRAWPGLWPWLGRPAPVPAGQPRIGPLPRRHGARGKGRRVPWAASTPSGIRAAPRIGRHPEALVSAPGRPPVVLVGRPSPAPVSVPRAPVCSAGLPVHVRAAARIALVRETRPAATAAPTTRLGGARRLWPRAATARRRRRRPPACRASGIVRAEIVAALARPPTAAIPGFRSGSASQPRIGLLLRAETAAAATMPIPPACHLPPGTAGIQAAILAGTAILRAAGTAILRAAGTAILRAAGAPGLRAGARRLPRVT
jgi:hypothetical protein